MSEATATETEQEGQDGAAVEAKDSSSEAKDSSSEAQGAAPGEAHLLDFSQPTRFTSDLRLRLARALEPFCEAVSARLTTELGAAVELRQRSEHQRTWAAAHAALAHDSLQAAIRVKPIGKEMLLALDQPLTMRTLNCLVGGSPADEPESRRLTDIDRALIRRLIDAMVGQLSLTWRDLAGLELGLEQIEVGAEASAGVPASEPTLTVVMECSIDGHTSELSLLMPWASVESLAGSHQTGAAATADPQQARALQLGLAGAKMLVRAEIGGTNLAVERVLAIAPGSLLRLDAKAEHGVRLISERVALARGVPGRSGVRRAVKLTTGVTPQTDTSARPLPSVAVHHQSGSAEDAAALLERLSHLRRIDLRVWAELGRTHLSLGRALRLPQGALVELDEGAEDPVGLYVNGVRLASGALAVTPYGDWAVQVEKLG